MKLNKLFTLFAMSLPFVGSQAIFAEEPPPDGDPILIPALPPKGNKKNIPAKYQTYLFYTYPEACLSTSMPYSCAIIDVADEDGNVYSSMMATPHESCGLLDLQPSSTITVTFDNGTILQGKY